jgi:catechol 2,3-dioxygenase-like lactoylglutathione lyase family enzyme
MTDAQDSVVLDCPDPAALAGFYRCLLGGEPEDVGADRVDLVGTWVAIGFHRVDESPRTGPGGEGPASDGAASDGAESDGAESGGADGAGARPEPHLDIDVADLDAAHHRVIRLGAVLLDASHAPDWQVYADPAGHLFCLVSS